MALFLKASFIRLLVCFFYLFCTIVTVTVTTQLSQKKTNTVLAKPFSFSACLLQAKRVNGDPSTVAKVTPQLIIKEEDVVYLTAKQVDFNFESNDKSEGECLL